MNDGAGVGCVHAGTHHLSRAPPCFVILRPKPYQPTHDRQLCYRLCKSFLKRDGPGGAPRPDCQRSKPIAPQLRTVAPLRKGTRPTTPFILIDRTRGLPVRYQWSPGSLPYPGASTCPVPARSMSMRSGTRPRVFPRWRPSEIPHQPSDLLLKRYDPLPGRKECLCAGELGESHGTRHVSIRRTDPLKTYDRGRDHLPKLDHFM